MGSIFKNLKGTTSNTFTIGKPSSPEQVVGLIAWDKYDTKLDVSNTSYQLYRKATFYLPVGLYRVGYLYHWRYSSASRDIKVKCFFDSNTIAYHRQEPKDTGNNQRYITSHFDYVEVTTEGDHNMKIKVSCENSSDKATIFRSVMEMWRVL